MAGMAKDTWAKRVERYHAILRDQHQGPGLYLEKQGINPSTLAEELADHLRATKQHVFCYQGEVVLSDPMVDWQTRGRALELAIKLWGMMPSDKIELSVPEVLVNRIIEARKRANGDGATES